MDSPFYASCVAAGYSCVSLCSVFLFVCPHSRRKTAGAINTKLGRPIIQCRTSACIEVKRSRSDFSSLFATGCMMLPARELHVDSTADDSSYICGLGELNNCACWLNGGAGWYVIQWWGGSTQISVAVAHLFSWTYCSWAEMSTPATDWGLTHKTWVVFLMCLSSSWWEELYL